MEFLKDIALPQSAEHIQLLHYMLILILFLFIPFIGAIFGGTAISLFYKKKEKADLDNNCRRLSKDSIELTTINKNVGLILGIIPLLTVILIFSQLFKSADFSNLIYLSISLLLLTISLNYIYDYRNSFRYLGSVDLNSGMIGLTFLFFALWLFSAGISVAVFYENWQSEGIIDALFSPVVIIRFLFLLALSVAIAGSAILFGVFYIDRSNGNDDKDYGDFVKQKLVRITFTATVLLPILIFTNLVIIPGSTLSVAVFAYIMIGLILLFLAYHFLYMIYIKFSSKYVALLYFTLLFMILTVIIGDQLIISNSTKVHSATLALNYDEILKELKGEAGPVEINGEDIYNVKCASCHKFDRKLVGPPHNEVVPKYFGKEAQLVAFIKNPTKIDPEYPPMPNPGLRPNEAKAVVDYILKKVKEDTQ
jgi:cytochrome c